MKKPYLGWVEHDDKESKIKLDAQREYMADNGGENFGFTK